MVFCLNSYQVRLLYPVEFSLNLKFYRQMKWIRETIGFIPSFSIYENKISVIEDTIESNPDLCVETCKSLIEGICKTILTNKGIDYTRYEHFNVLVKVTTESIFSENESDISSLSELARRIAAVAQKISEIRDLAGFASHGQDIQHASIGYTLALFTSRITDVIGGFILQYYHSHSSRRTNRVLYEDNGPFNEYYDELNPIQIGDIVLSASEALYTQDIEAYKTELFYYLEQLEEGTIEI